MAKPGILVIGSSNADMIMQLDPLPLPGETILGGEFITAAGGKGANQAVAAARAGGDVTFVARIGRDMFGEEGSVSQDWRPQSNSFLRGFWATSRRHGQAQDTDPTRCIIAPQINS